MNDQLLQLAMLLRAELTEVERVLLRLTECWQRYQNSADDYYLDGVALNLHGFYGGLERIFERIAVAVDGAKPAGDVASGIITTNGGRSARITASSDFICDAQTTG